MAPGTGGRTVPAMPIAISAIAVSQSLVVTGLGRVAGDH